MLFNVGRPPAGSGPTQCAAWVDGVPASVDLAAHGYVEDEFFISGRANVYKYADDGVRVIVGDADVPYRTRLLVRRPVDPDRSTGVVHLEPLHPSLTFDTVKTFADAWRYLLSSGHTWVGVTCKPNAVGSLVRFNPIRYAGLAMADRGQLFDLLTTVGLWLRTDAATKVLAGQAVRRVYASGWSMTGSFLRTYVADEFHARARAEHGADPFDGYLIGISSGEFESGYTPLNDVDGPDPTSVENQLRRRTIPVGDARRVMRPPGVPVIELMSEAEALANLTSRRPDSDEAGDQFRLYEVSGRGHITARMADFQALSRVPMSQLGIAPPGLPGFNDFPVSPTNSWPTHVLTGQALENLHRWRSAGTPPPRCSPIDVRAGSPPVAAVDDAGNALGGLRHVFVEIPIASYVSSAGAGNPLARGPLTPWYGSSLGVDELTSRYGSFDGYLREFSACVEAMMRQRWLNPVDAPECLEWAVRQKSLFERF